MISDNSTEMRNPIFDYEIINNVFKYESNTLDTISKKNIKKGNYINVYFNNSESNPVLINCLPNEKVSDFNQKIQRKIWR